jgi:DnaJ-class molecular chaperone
MLHIGACGRAVEAEGGAREEPETKNEWIGHRHGQVAHNLKPKTNDKVCTTQKGMGRLRNEKKIMRGVGSTRPFCRQVGGGKC